MIKLRHILLGISILLLSNCSQPDSSQREDTDTSITTEKTRFIWDFSKPKKYIYSYSQSVKGQTSFGVDEQLTWSDMTGEGFINIRVKENGLADLSITDVLINSVEFDDDGNPVDTMTNKMPATVMQDMSPEGHMNDPGSDILFNLLFPLPSYDLELDETDELPLKMPMNASGSRLWSKGTNTLTHVGNEKIASHRCEVFIGDIDLSELEVPEELTGEFRNSLKGNATYYFDTKNHHYVGADVHFRIEALMNSGTDQEDGPGGFFMDMFSENSFRIRLVEIEGG